MINLLQAEKLKQTVSEMEKKARESGNGKNIDRATRSLHSTVRVFMHDTPQQRQRLQQQQGGDGKYMSNKKRKQMARLEAWLARVKANEANGDGSGQKRPRPSSSFKPSANAAAIAAEEAKNAEAKKMKKKQASAAKRKRMQALQQ